MRLCISNPPYNLKWKHHDFATLDERFAILPSESNANFAFVQIALSEADKAVLILPQSILKPSGKPDICCLKYLVDKNYIEAVVTCPDKMFVSTSISVCLLFLNKNKQTTTVEFIDMSEYCATETREQTGQFGGKSHEKRIYKKEFNVFAQEHIEYILDCIKERKTEQGKCRCVTAEDIKKGDYSLLPGAYIEQVEQVDLRRSYKDIVRDLNRVISQRNLCKLTINKTLAKNLGLDTSSPAIDMKNVSDLVQKLSGEAILNDDHITFTASAVLKFENKGSQEVSPILMMIFETYKQHIYYLNNEENRYLAELRDALLPDLMSGKIDIG